VTLPTSDACFPRGLTDVSCIPSEAEGETARRVQMAQTKVLKIIKKALFLPNSIIGVCVHRVK